MVPSARILGQALLLLLISHLLLVYSFQSHPSILHTVDRVLVLNSDLIMWLPYSKSWSGIPQPTPNSWLQPAFTAPPVPPPSTIPRSPSVPTARLLVVSALPGMSLSTSAQKMPTHVSCSFSRIFLMPPCRAVTFASVSPYPFICTYTHT